MTITLLMEMAAQTHAQSKMGGVAPTNQLHPPSAVLASLPNYLCDSYFVNLVQTECKLESIFNQNILNTIK